MGTPYRDAQAAPADPLADLFYALRDYGPKADASHLARERVRDALVSLPQSYRDTLLILLESIHRGGCGL